MKDCIEKMSKGKNIFFLLPDSDPVGSAFMWVRGSGSWGIKLRKIEEFNQQSFAPRLLMLFSKISLLNISQQTVR